MAIFLSVIALLTAFIGGLGVVLLYRSADSPLDVLELCGTALILGAGLVGFSSFWLGLLFQGVLLRCTVIGLCLLAAIFGIKKSKRMLPKSSLPPLAPPYVVLLVLAVVAVSYVVWLSLYRAHLGWDGLFVWESKARAAFLSNGAIPIRYYQRNVDWFHSSYPPMLPMLEAWLFGFLGRVDESMIKLVGPYFYLAAVLLVVSVANREFKGRWSGNMVLLPFFLVPALIFGEGSATSGYADFPLAAIYLCCVVHLVGFWRTRSLESAKLAGVSAMLLPFIKSDGIIPLMCIAVAIAPLVIRDRDWKAGSWVVLPGLGVALSWSVFLAIRGVHARDFLPMTPAVLFSHLDRAKPLLFWTLKEITNWAHWSILWLLSFVAIAFLILHYGMSRWFPWIATVFLPLVLYPCVYFFSAWEQVEPHVLSSLPRLLIQIAPAAALMTGLTFAYLTDDPQILGQPWRVADEVILPTKTAEHLLKEAAEILAPIGLTPEDVLTAYDDSMADRLLKEAAQILRPAGVKLEHLRRVYDKSQMKPAPTPAKARPKSTNS